MQNYITISPTRPSPRVVIITHRQRELVRRARALRKRRQEILDDKLHETPKRHYPTWLQVALHH